MITIKDLKSKASSTESDGVYIMPFNPKYEKDELEERMLKVVEEQPSVALRFLCLIGDYKVGTSKQYISQIIDSNDIPSLGESMLIASPTGSGKTSAVIKMIKHTSMPVIYVTNRKMTLCQFKRTISRHRKDSMFLQSCLTAFPWERTSSPLPIKNLLRQRISIKAKNTSSYLTKSIVCWKMLISQCTQRKLFGI